MKANMRPSAVVALLVVTIAIFSSGSVQSGSNSDAKVAGHLVVSSKNSCSTAPKPACDEGFQTLNIHGNLQQPYHLYILVMDADSTNGVAGVTFGIKYNNVLGVGMDVWGWNLCGESEYRGGPPGVTWPESQSGNIIVWDRVENCQKSPASGDLDGGVTVPVGSFYVYAYSNDKFEITHRSYGTISELSIVDCLNLKYRLPHPGNSGKVGFGNQQGDDPCQ